MGSHRDDERETPSTVPAVGPVSASRAGETDPAPHAASLDATLPSSHSEHGAGDYSSFVTVSAEYYQMGKEIARGGMGRIFLARDRRLGRAVAVKEILVAAGEAARRFEREARITARLQHPSIVNVHEGGVFPSGELFYSMALVSGRSFDRAIDDAKTLEARLALLPNVLAVADAMAYAHGERVIHRDLKPGNVLVGAFGETVVIDWGLAKDLADSSAAPEQASAPFRDGSGSDAGMTSVGAVMGTPGYMPPEQAEGRAVDERADVYAIGAILHHALSGQAPYEGDSALDILAAVRRGPPIPLSERQPGVPADLLAIVARAMARDPATRYPTARELADDLRRYQTGQLVGAHHYSLGQLLRRWADRNRAALSVAGVATAVLLVFGATAIRRIIDAEHLAGEQRALAQENRQQAEDLLGFMLVDLRDKLQPLGRLDFLDDVAKKAVAYYARQGEQLGDAALAKRSVAHSNLGDVLSAQGHTDGALQEYRLALSLDEALATKDPTDTERQRNVSTDHIAIGDVLVAQGSFADALVQYGSAASTQKALLAKDPANPTWQQDLALIQERVGTVRLDQGDPAGALTDFRDSLTTREGLAAREPTNADRQRTLSVSHNKVGGALLALGDGAGALARFRASLDLREKLAAMDPTNAERQEDLSSGQSRIGDALLAQGDPAGALAMYLASMAISEKLAANDPTSADRQRALMSDHAKVGDVFRVLGDPVAALQHQQASLAISEKLAAKDPTNNEEQRRLALASESVGDALFARGDAAGALAKHQTALTIRQALRAAEPLNADRQRDVCVSQLRVGDMLVVRGNAADALTAFQASLGAAEKIAAPAPTNVELQRLVVLGSLKVGNVLFDAGQLPGALVKYRAALAVSERLAALDPTNAERQHDVVMCSYSVGRVLLAQGDAAGALEGFRTWLDGAIRLAEKEPANADRQWDVLAGHSRVGDALFAQGDAAGALAEYQAGLPILQRLLARYPKNEQYRSFSKAYAADLKKAAQRSAAPRGR